MDIALDTNILLYAADQRSPFHQTALTWINRSQTGEFRAYLVANVLYEMVAVLTSKPYRDRISGQTAQALYDFYLDNDSFTKLSPTQNTPYLIRELLKSSSHAENYIHDLVIAAVLREYGVPALLTSNVRDFSGLDLKIIALTDDLSGE